MVRELKPPVPQATRYAFATYDGHACPNVAPCDENVLAALMLREFSGTATCSSFDVGLYNVTSADYRIPIMHFNSTHWLSTAGRSNEAQWVRMHAEAAQDGRPDKLGLTAFCKDEPYPGKDVEAVKPRVILAANPQAAVAFNPPMFALTQFWKTHRLQDMCPAFGMTRDDVGDWVEEAMSHYADPVFVENDCSAFDASVHVQALWHEREFCRLFTDASPEWLDLYALQFTRDVTTSSGALRYSRVGGRSSGVGNTSFGNTYINLCMHKTAAAGRPCHMLALGDDILIVCERPAAASLCADFETSLSRWGFRPKAKWTDTPEQAEFCSSYIARTTDGRLTLVPKTGKQLLKLSRAFSYAHYSAISAGVFSSSPDPLLRAFWSKLPTPDEAVAVDENPYSISSGQRMASWDSVVARYGPIFDVVAFIGDFVPGQNAALDAVFSVDYPELSGPFAAHPFPPRLRLRLKRPGPSPAPQTVPAFDGQAEEPEWEAHGLFYAT